MDWLQQRHRKSMSAIMKSLNWPNNNTYINITLLPHISIWHVQPATSKSHITNAMCIHPEIPRHTPEHACYNRHKHTHLLKDSWLAHAILMVTTCANMWDVPICTVSLLYNFYVQYCVSEFDGTSWLHMVTSCDAFSPSTYKQVMSPLGFPVQAQSCSLSPHIICKLLRWTCILHNRCDWHTWSVDILRKFLCIYSHIKVPTIKMTLWWIQKFFQCAITNFVRKVIIELQISYFWSDTIICSNTYNFDAEA